MKQSGASIPSYELRRHESVRVGIQRAAVEYSKLAQAQAKRPASEFHEATHASRLILKRLRSILRLLAPSLPAAWVRKELKRLRVAAAALAPARDAAVQDETLGAVLRDGPAHETASAAALRTCLAKSRGSKRNALRSPRGPLTSVARAAAATVRGLHKVSWQDHGWSVIAHGLEKSYRKARRRYRNLNASDGEKRFHAWRTASKSLYYQLLLVRPVSPIRLGALARTLDLIQDQLGAEHDLALLEKQLRRIGTRFPDAALLRRVQQGVAHRKSRLRKRSLKEGRRAFHSRPGDLLERMRSDWKRWRKRAS